MKYLLDTDICIYIIRKRPETVFSRFKACEIGDIGMSSITYSELYFGVFNSQNIEKNRLALEGFVAPLEVVPYDQSVCSYYGKVRSNFKKTGTTIGPLDTLIAAHALSLDVILVTNNLKEFNRIDSLRVEAWI